jgi:beta-glucosidase
MKKFRIIVTMIYAMLCIISPRVSAKEPDVKSIVNQMTLEEKAMLVVGMGKPQQEANAPVAGQAGQKVPGAAGTTASIPRLKIPSLVLVDGPAGVRISPIRKKDSTKTFYATGFPVATLLASSWDTSLVEKVGRAFGSEALEYGVDILLAPGMNIQRNPLCGRNFEYYSEDPLVTGSMAAAFVKGVQSKGVGTSVKHFAANNQETNRKNVNAIVSERALREIYLRGFEIAVKKAAPWTVMSSYNKINGVYTSESADLLTKILRDDWKYRGMVMTDWGGGSDPVAQTEAGNDLIMPGTPAQVQAIIDAVNNKTLTMDALDRNVERIVTLIRKTPSYRKYHYSNAPKLKENAKASRAAAAQGMVLLKNDGNALPLRKGSRIALFGNTSYELIAGGTGSGDVHKAYRVALAEGCRNAKYRIDDSLKRAYEAYLRSAKAAQPKGERNSSSAPVEQMPVSGALASRMASSADAAIITIGRNAGEGHDRTLDGDFYLTQTENDLITNVADEFHAKGKKVTVVLNIGGVIEVKSWSVNVDAILLAWQPGQEGGNAICDILSGAVNPSGKLAVTFPADYKDVPSASNFPGTPKEKPEQVMYSEGIYVGYRYYTTFNVRPAYEFGYGLSYTTFSYSPVTMAVSKKNGQLTASVKITNMGAVPGREVAELYISAPGKAMAKPAEELRGFGKTRLLKPGESEVLTFPLGQRELASFDQASSAWTIEAGRYQVKLGASSADIRQTTFFELPKEILVEKVSKALVPKQALDELKK